MFVVDSLHLFFCGFFYFFVALLRDLVQIAHAVHFLGSYHFLDAFQIAVFLVSQFVLEGFEEILNILEIFYRQLFSTRFLIPRLPQSLPILGRSVLLRKVNQIRFIFILSIDDLLILGLPVIP